MFLQRLMPDFLGIGAQRAGTTWLWVYLRRHPQIWTPRTKELHFFDRALPDRAGTLARARYGVRFLPGRLAGRVVGEITPAYAALPEDRVALIASWMPAARVIYLVRDPVDRAWSQAVKGFAAWAGRPLERATEDVLLSFFNLPEVRTRGDYIAALRLWRRYFPPHQVLVCLSEEMFAEPVRYLRHLFAFVGVDPDVPLDTAALGRRMHAGRHFPIPMPVRKVLENTLYAQRTELESILGRTLPWGR